MNYLFFGLAGALALVDWVAVSRGWQRVEFFAKPATMLALLAFVLATGGVQAGIVWFILGLVFSLAGDVFLMLPRNLFVPGLVAFLLAHVAYIIGFSPVPPLKTPHLLVAVLIIVLVALPAVQLYRRIAAALQVSGQTNMKGPVLAYTLAISLMLVSALFTMLRGSWLPFNAIAVSFGALLFLLSDSILAWDRFVAPVRSARVRVMVTYHLGQLLIALGATLQLINGPVS